MICSEKGVPAYLLNFFQTLKKLVYSYFAWGPMKFDLRIHCRYLHSPLEIYVSMMIWAPLKKSPNWASQIMRLLGCSMLIPYSKPSTASSDKALFASCIGENTVYRIKVLDNIYTCKFLLLFQTSKYVITKRRKIWPCSCSSRRNLWTQCWFLMLK